MFVCLLVYSLSCVFTHFSFPLSHFLHHFLLLKYLKEITNTTCYWLIPFPDLDLEHVPIRVVSPKTAVKKFYKICWPKGKYIYTLVGFFFSVKERRKCVINRANKLIPGKTNIISLESKSIVPQLLATNLLKFPPTNHISLKLLKFPTKYSHSSYTIFTQIRAF